MSKKNPSIKEVAEACGVSIGTVDRALHNRPDISSKTRDRILQVAKEMNYRTDMTARSLVTGETKSIGLVIFDVNNSYFSQLVNSIVSKASELGYFVYVTITNGSKIAEKDSIHHLVSRKVDGLIIHPVSEPDDFKEISINDIPTVTIGNKVSDNWHHIGVCDYDAAQKGVSILKDKGYKRIVYVAPPIAKRGKVNLYGQERRLEGVMDMERQETSDIVYNYIEDDSYFEHTDAIIRNVKKDHIKTVLFCSSDVYAIRLLNYLAEKGINVPEDIGVMGFDHIEFTKFLKPRLNSIIIPTNEIGAIAVESVIDLIKGKDKSDDDIVPFNIADGDSI